MKVLHLSLYLGLSCIGSIQCALSEKTAHEVGRSSEPVNAGEAREYKKALLRCHKTGGSRIVKINSQLKCY
jgi:hypothetical protein